MDALAEAEDQRSEHDREGKRNLRIDGVLRLHEGKHTEYNDYKKYDARARAVTAEI